jgi:hypothetical protein
VIVDEGLLVVPRPPFVQAILHARATQANSPTHTTRRTAATPISHRGP